MKKQLIPISIFLLSLFYGCKSETEKIIITVNGPIPAGEMGTTLVHEHVLVDFIGADSTGYHRWNKDEVVERVTPFLEEIQEYEVSTLIECTPAFVGRDPMLLKRLSEKTGMNLVTNTGYYGARTNHFIPKEFYSMSARELSARWVDEFENGIEGSGIRPGFIKIAVDRDDTLSPEHIKIVSAAALTHNKTGLAIASHTGPEGPAFEQIKVLQSYGVDPSHFIWVHAQRGSLDGNIRAAKMGAWISIDNVNGDRTDDPEALFSIQWHANRILALKEAGLLHRVLISHDAGWYSPGQENGGTFRDYKDIFTDLIPALNELGFTQTDIDQLLIRNPIEAYSIKGGL
jgi:phosphotriesterase-related protein